MKLRRFFAALRFSFSRLLVGPCRLGVFFSFLFTRTCRLGASAQGKGVVKGFY